MTGNFSNASLNKLVVAAVLFGAVGAQAARKNRDFCIQDPYVSGVVIPFFTDTSS
jgi:hypothetical protein